ncbi:MAG: Flp pilus assembly protein CpaB [Pseudomonadota bacterium]
MPPVRPAGGFTRKKGGESLRVALLGGSLLVIVGAILVVQSMSVTQPSPPPAQPTPVPAPLVELIDCLVAAEKIEPGTPLDPSRFRKETRPVMSGGATVVTSFDKLRGAYAASFIAAGQPLLTDYMTTKAPVNEIQANIPEGFRAVAVAVDDVSNVEGWVRAGAKVDVLLASQVANKPAITLLAQNAQVLSTGKVSGGKNGKGAGGSTTITIMVTVEEATKIQLAASTGVMSLALRGDEDTVESADNQTVNLDAVFGLSPSQSYSGPPREGRITFGGRNYVIVGGKLVPEESVESAPAKPK